MGGSDDDAVRGEGREGDVVPDGVAKFIVGDDGALGGG